MVSLAEIAVIAFNLHQNAGGVLAAIAAYCSVAFLTRYFKNNDLRPFGWYCLIAGTVCFVLARMGVIS